MARKFDEARALELAERGVSVTDIARLLDVNKSTISRFLREQSDEIMDLDTFKANHPALLAALQRSAVDVRFKVLRELNRRGVENLSDHELRNLYQTLTTCQGIDFDKGRLLEGQSTQNISVLTQIKRKLDDLDPV